MSILANPDTDSKAPQQSSSKRKNYVTTIDKSQADRGFLQYLAVWIWIGWIFFYLVFMVSLPFLYFYAPTLLTTVVWLMIFSAFMPIDERCQPKVTKEHHSKSSLGLTLLLLPQRQYYSHPINDFIIPMRITAWVSVRKLYSSQSFRLLPREDGVS